MPPQNLSTLSNLPREVWTTIFSYLVHSDVTLARLLHVSKHVRTILLSANLVWFECYKQKYPILNRTLSFIPKASTSACDIGDYDKYQGRDQVNWYLKLRHTWKRRKQWSFEKPLCLPSEYVKSLYPPSGPFEKVHESHPTLESDELASRLAMILTREVIVNHLKKVAQYPLALDEEVFIQDMIPDHFFENVSSPSHHFAISVDFWGKLDTILADQQLHEVTDDIPFLHRHKGPNGLFKRSAILIFDLQPDPVLVDSHCFPYPLTQQSEEDIHDTCLIFFNSHEHRLCLRHMGNLGNWECKFALQMYDTSSWKSVGYFVPQNAHILSDIQVLPASDIFPLPLKDARNSKTFMHALIGIEHVWNQADSMVGFSEPVKKGVAYLIDFEAKDEKVRKTVGDNVYTIQHAVSYAPGCVLTAHDDGAIRLWHVKMECCLFVLQGLVPHCRYRETRFCFMDDPDSYTKEATSWNPPATQILTSISFSPQDHIQLAAWRVPCHSELASGDACSPPPHDESSLNQKDLHFNPCLLQHHILMNHPAESNIASLRTIYPHVMFKTRKNWLIIMELETGLILAQRKIASMHCNQARGIHVLSENEMIIGLADSILLLTLP